MEIKLVDINLIQPYSKNPRINDNAVDKVAASIKEFGFRQPLVVDENMVLITGHTRLKAAYKLGFKELPIHIASGLTPEQIKAYRIADNRVAQDSSWDSTLLNYELTDLKEMKFDLELTGFTDFELDGYLNPKEDERFSDNFDNRLDKNKTATCPRCNHEFEI